MEQSAEISELIKALVKAKGDFKPIAKEGENPFLKTKYITLHGIVKATEEALRANGLVIYHYEDESDGREYLVTRLAHESGQYQESRTWFSDQYLVAEKNEKGNYKTTPLQVKGSAISYIRRYHLGELLGIVVDEDNDGNAQGKGKAQDQKQLPEDLQAIKDTLDGIDKTSDLDNWKAKHGKEVNTRTDKDAIWAYISQRAKALTEKPSDQKPKEDAQPQASAFLTALKKTLAGYSTIDKLVEIFNKNESAYKQNPEFDAIKLTYAERKAELANEIMAKNMGVDLADLVAFRKDVADHGIDKTLIDHILANKADFCNELKNRILQWKKEREAKASQ